MKIAKKLENRATVFTQSGPIPAIQLSPEQSVSRTPRF
jgi:hypothetical protein